MRPDGIADAMGCDGGPMLSGSIEDEQFLLVEPNRSNVAASAERRGLKSPS